LVVIHVPLDQPTGDLVHRYYQQQYQIDGGRIDRLTASWSRPSRSP
jgi:hypothetical protein